MLDNLSGPSQDQIIQRIKASRAAKAEPEAPTAEPVADAEAPSETEAEQPLSQLVESESEEMEAEAPESELLEGEEAETELSEEVAEAETDDLEESYLDLDGREISLKQIKEWEQGYLRQSDYTRKTQALAEDRKEVETIKQSLQERQKKLDEALLMAEQIVKESDEEVNLEELREYDPEAYLDHIERQEKRKKALEEAKKTKSGLSEAEQEEITRTERAKLLEKNPQWVKNGQLTEEYKRDEKMVADYMTSLGFTPEDQKGITSAKMWLAILDAARFNASKKQSASIAKKVKKAPVVTKPKAGSSTTNQAEINRLKERVRKYGKIEDAMALRKLQSREKR